MHPFWETVTKPLLDAARPRRIVEIGAEQGKTTFPLLAWARENGATVDCIDPTPRFDVARAGFEHGETLRFHRGLSLELLPAIAACEVALIDGDHNWHTVHSELGLLAAAAERAGQPLPLVIAHDAGWPYGRRDMYYDPQTVPAEARHDAARRGIVPGRSELVDGGVNAVLWNATTEGGPRNGVLTAIEDFAAAHPGGCELVVVGGWHGLAVLTSNGRLEASPAIAAELERLRSPEFLTAQLERVERARVIAEAGRVRAERQRDETAERHARLEGSLLDPEPSGEAG